MTDLPIIILSSLLTSSGVSAIAAFLAKSYFERRLSLRFGLLLEEALQQHRKELADFQSQLDYARTSKDRFAEERFEAIRRISELVYRNRNLAREAVESGSTARAQPARESASALEQLKEAMFRFRLVIEEPLFASLHEYKESLSALHTSIRFAARETAKSETLREGIRLAYEKVELQYEPLVERLRSDS